MRIRRLALAALLVLAPGCSTEPTEPHSDSSKGRILVVDKSKRQPTATIELFQGAPPAPDRYYKQIALAWYRTSAGDELDAIDYFSRRAKAMGGEAVIMQEPSIEHKSFGTSHYEVYTYKAVIAVWTKEPNPTSVRF